MFARSVHAIKAMSFWFSGKEPIQCGDTGLILELGRSPGEGNGYSLQYSCLILAKNESSLKYSPKGHAKEHDHVLAYRTFFQMNVSSQQPNCRKSLSCSHCACGFEQLDVLMDTC